MNQHLELRSQLFKYLLVGVTSNGAAYGFYLLITSFGLSPVLGMSIVYVMAAGINYFLNRSWTFSSNAPVRRSLFRYVVVQCVGYATNLVLLAVLHYALGVPHYLAQLAGVTIVAGELFLLSRFFVFV
ncbi:GtrA family protein [Synechococcus sp. CCY 0621]|uniref:GtrA family protein n=1 Tax=Synechococcus sp. CCY 0621 TaxID=2815603 RepID=UPI001C22762A